jgi:hypothetical protein
MKIGLFDHVEHGNRPLATLFDERLTCTKAADDAGFYRRLQGGIGEARWRGAAQDRVPRRRRHRRAAPHLRGRYRGGGDAGSPSRMPPVPHYVRGYGAMFSQHIGPADEGCDFDFLAGKGQIAEPEIH